MIQQDYHDCFFFQAEDGIRDRNVTGVQTCALPISSVLRPIDTNVDGARSRSAPKQGTSGRARGATVAARVGEHAPLPLPSVLSCITLSYMSAVTIRLDPKLQRELDRLCRRLGRTRSEVVRDALRRQIALLRFDEGRRRLLPYAEAAGYLTDEDVFRDVS